MQVRRVVIDRFRSIEHVEILPTARNVLVGPNNAGKSSILEALDLVLHSGLGRQRAAPTELDYFDRNVPAGFEVEVVLGDLAPTFLALITEGLEGWKSETNELVPETDGVGIEAVVRVRARGTEELETLHEFAKPEVEGQRFGPRLRKNIAWVFDGRSRDPARQLAFYQGGVLDQLFSDVDLDPALRLLREALAEGADAVNLDASVAAVLDEIGGDLEALGLATTKPDFEAGFVSNRELLQTLRLAMAGFGAQAIPMVRQGRGAQRLVLLAVLLRLAHGHVSDNIIGGFEEPEEAVEPLRQVQAARLLRDIAEAGGQVFLTTHSPEIVRAFDSTDVILLDRGPDLRLRRVGLTSAARHGYERRLDMPLVRALFIRYPVMVEGVSDRSVFHAFWDALVASGDVPPAERIGIEAISAEGNTHVPMCVQILNEAGKSVVVWIELDDVIAAQRVIDQGNAHCTLAHAADPEHNNLERALSTGTSLGALAEAMSTIAEDRGDGWDAQRIDLLSRAGVVSDARTRATMKTCTSLVDALGLPPEREARTLVEACISAKSAPAPFEIKGGRSARLFAETIIKIEGVPPPFKRALVGLSDWIRAGAHPGARIDFTY